MPECVKSPVDLARLWMHECNRVYYDKLVDNSDMDLYDKIQQDMTRKFFEVGGTGSTNLGPSAENPLDQDVQFHALINSVPYFTFLPFFCAVPVIQCSIMSHVTAPIWRLFPVAGSPLRTFWALFSIPYRSDLGLARNYALVCPFFQTNPCPMKRFCKELIDTARKQACATSNWKTARFKSPIALDSGAWQPFYVKTTCRGKLAAPLRDDVIRYLLALVITIKIAAASSVAIQESFGTGHSKPVLFRSLSGKFDYHLLLMFAALFICIVPSLFFL